MSDYVPDTVVKFCMQFSTQTLLISHVALQNIYVTTSKRVSCNVRYTYM